MTQIYLPKVQAPDNFILEKKQRKKPVCNKFPLTIVFAEAEFWAFLLSSVCELKTPLGGTRDQEIQEP